MEDEPVNVIRESRRNFLKLSRHFHRNEEADERRCIEKISISAESIAEVANKLKTKSSVSVAELQTLKNGLMEDPKNIEAVMNTHGTVRGLVRELTGSNATKQIIAAECVANLALDARAALTLSKAVGPYLIASLDSLNYDLADVSACALGNMCAGARSAHTTLVQGAGAKLCAALRSAGGESALYALTHCAYVMKDDLGIEYLTSLLTSLSNMDITMTTAQLLFYLSCHKDFNEHLPQKLIQNVLEDLPNSLKTHVEECTQNRICCKLVYLVRILANVSVNELVYELFLSVFVSFVNEFRIILGKEGVLRESLLWLIGNLFNFRNDHAFFECLLKLN